MAQDPQCPPQEELKYRLRRDKPLFDGDIAVAADITSKWFRDNAYCVDTQAIRVCMDSPFGPDVVYTHCEVTDPDTRLGILMGGIQKGTEEYKPLAIDDEGRLCVDAAISIGEVQLDVEIRALDDDSVGIWGHVDQDTGQIEAINITDNGHIRVALHDEDGALLTDDNPLAVSDRSNVGGDSATIQINNTAKIINVSGAGNMLLRRSITIQPLQGVCYWGLSATDQPHRLARRDYAVLDIGPDIDLYVRKTGVANHDLAVTEMS